MKSHEDLEVYQNAFDLAIRVRKESLKLESHDRYEGGSQIRRSSQSIVNYIVEGYGRRQYKADFVKFLIYSYSSLQEAKSQSKFIYISTENKSWNGIYNELNKLGIKLYNFINYVKDHWKVPNR